MAKISWDSWALCFSSKSYPAKSQVLSVPILRCFIKWGKYSSMVGWCVKLHCSRTGCHLEYLLASLYFLVHNFPSIYFLILPIKIVFWRKFKFQKKQLYQGTPVHWVKRNWMMFNEKGSKESERWTHSPEWSPILSRGEDGKVFRQTLTMMITNDVDQWSSTWPTCFNTPFSPL